VRVSLGHALASVADLATHALASIRSYYSDQLLHRAASVPAPLPVVPRCCDPALCAPGRHHPSAGVSAAPTLHPARQIHHSQPSPWRRTVTLASQSLGGG
jgi:hypothetical protein